MAKLNRRDFLKLAGLVSGSAAFANISPRWFKLGQGRADAGQPNVFIFVFDAMSAENLSLYGYHRKTSPNLERFAGRANVYHNHHSAGNFTSSGTASLLTGLYPWTHRAINEGGLISRALAGNNIFRLFGNGYNRFAYSQNVWANYFFGQFKPEIETVFSPGAFSAASQVVAPYLGGNLTDSYRAFDDFLFQDGSPPASLVFGLLSRLFVRRQAIFAQTDEYPRGIPRAGNYPIFFKLKEVFDGLISSVESFSAPTLGYFHLWAPHAPYKPSQEFVDIFADNWKPEKKPLHRLGAQIPNSDLNTRRKNYDEYVANVDAEFGRMIDTLTAKGILDKSYVIVTSDHGESFERGEEGHVSALLFEPLVHIPLLISSPGQISRHDITVPTNSVDVLPTLLHLAGRDIPSECEGELLPGLGGQENPARSSFSVEAKSNPAFSALKKASVAMRKGKYKMIYYTGYEAADSFELYDLENDREELNDLYPAGGTSAGELRAELLAKFAGANQKYKR